MAKGLKRKKSLGKQKGIRWRRIPGFGRYLISEHGIIKLRIKNRARKRGHVLKGSIDPDGYSRVTLINDDGKECTMLGVHRLVAQVFIGPQPSKKKFQVQHIDDDKRNNHYTNLRWGTRSQNAQDSIRNGTFPNHHGELSPSAKLTWRDVRKIRFIYARSEVTCAKLAGMYGVTFQNIWCIVNHKSWVERNA